MKVLLDECTPRRLKHEFGDLDVTHVADLGWQGRRNGRLLASMRDSGFDTLVTVDRNLQFQQNLPEAGIAVLVLRATTNRVADLRRLIPEIRELLRTVQPGHVYRVGV